MKKDDFRFMRRGKYLSGLKKGDLSILEAIHKKKEGTEHALLVLHGFSSSPAVYRNLIPKLKNYNAILCPVLPGHAESIDDFAKVTAKDWLNAANLACKELMKEYKKVDVLGLSLGGLLAFELSKHFELNHLYLLAPALKLKMRVNIMLKLAHLLKRLGFHHFRNAGGNIFQEGSAELAYRQLPITTIIEMLQLSHDFEWASPKCPVDLFLGEHDTVVDSQFIEAMCASMTNVQIHWLKNSAHVLPLDNDVQEIIDCINKQA